LAAFVLFLCTCWVTFDSLFAPFAPRGERVEIPDYRGKSAEELVFAEWMRVTTEYRYDEKIPAGQVISQTPVGGSLRKLSQKHPTCGVTLVVSLGEESLVLPDLIGGEERDVTARLRSLGFSVYVKGVAGNFPQGEVLGMDPAPGTALPKGASVTLTVSEGIPDVSVTVPELRGLVRADALMRIWTAQLAVGEVVEVPSTEPSGIVLRQSHLAGTTVRAGTKITIYVSSPWEDETTIFPPTDGAE
jgi:serine/threonine-protein kinase